MAPGRHPLLPAEFHDEPDGRRSPRDWLVDVALFVFALAVGAIVVGDTWSEHSDLALLVDFVAGSAALVALWFRRSHPMRVLAFAMLASAFSAFAAGAGTVALFNAVIRAPRRSFPLILALCAPGVLVFPLLYPSSDSYLFDVVFGLLLSGVVIGWGLFVRARRQLVLSLRDRAERLEAEQRLRVEQAREAERRRIAREMHDVLAHRVSLLSLHAGALEFRPDATPEEIAEAAGVIRSTAHAALSDLREVIGVLRETEDGDVGPEPPQPTLADIPALVEESRAAGMRVSCRIEVAEDAAVPAALGRTAYRIVQEGLTNARKHAPAAAVDVSVDGGEELVVTVVSRRPVGVGARAPLAGTGAGTGLIGLSERVGLAGGTLRHGPDAAGDFVLRAVLPWT
jgi:signal transduction histidine kinase